MDITTMSAQEFQESIIELLELAEMAIKGATTIRNYYSPKFDNGNNELHVYHYEYAEGEYCASYDGYLTIDNVFRFEIDASDEASCWEIPWDAEFIFKVLKAEYLHINGLENLIPYDEHDYISYATYLKTFIQEHLN